MAQYGMFHGAIETINSIVEIEEKSIPKLFYAYTLIEKKPVDSASSVVYSKIHSMFD